MNKLNIEVGDRICFHKINFNDRSVVISNKVAELLDYYQTVEDVTDSTVTVDSCDEPIPIEWVKEIIWKHFTDEELARQKELDNVITEEQNKYILYKKTILCNGILGTALFVFSPLYLIPLFCKGIIPGCLGLIPFLYGIFDVIGAIVINSAKSRKKVNFAVAEATHKRTNCTYDELVRLKLNYGAYDYYKSIGEIKDDD